MHNFNLDQLGAFVQGGIYTTLLAFNKTAYNGLYLIITQKSKTVIEVSAVVKSQKMQSYAFSTKDSTDSILRNTLSFSEDIDNNFQEWEEKAEQLIKEATEFK